MLIYRIVYVLYFEKLITTLEKFQMICNNGSMRTELRGVLMAGNLAEEQKYKVGWAYLHNDGNFAFQKSYGCENLGGEHKALTTATNEAETRMNSVFAGGGCI